MWPNPQETKSKKKKKTKSKKKNFILCTVSTKFGDFITLNLPLEFTSELIAGRISSF